MVVVFLLNETRRTKALPRSLVSYAQYPERMVVISTQEWHDVQDSYLEHFGERVYQKEGFWLRGIFYPPLLTTLTPMLLIIIPLYILPTLLNGQNLEASTTILIF